MIISFRHFFVGAVLCALLPMGSISAAAEPVEYVKICSVYGAGFYYIPGTDICLRVPARRFDVAQTDYSFRYRTVSGRVDVPISAEEETCQRLGLQAHRVPVGGRDTCMSLKFDPRQQTAYGTVRGYFDRGGFNYVPGVPASAPSNFGLFDPRQFQDQRGPVTSFAPQYTAELGSGLHTTLEVTGFAGGLNATTSGQTSHAGLIGGFSAVGLKYGTVPFTVQFSAEGVATGSYSLAAGDRWYVGDAAHFLWLPMSNVQIGGLVGTDTGKALFTNSHTTDWFAGIEAKYLGNGWMVGAMGGYSDLSTGTPIQTRVDWFDVRARLSLGVLAPGWNAFTLGGAFGYSTGKLANTQIGATSTQWNVSAAYSVPNTPLTVYAGYTGYENRTDTSGVVHRESIYKAGATWNFGRVDMAEKIEVHSPNPLFLRSRYSF